MNTTNKVLLTLVAVIIIVGSIYIFSQKRSNTNTSAETLARNQDNASEGSVIFSVTDATADMNSISEINMQVNKVEIHDNTGGWTTVSTNPRTYSLLKLNAENKSELLSNNMEVKSGTYDQVRLTLDSIAIKTKSGTTKTAKLPSNELTLNTNLVVNDKQTSSVNFDFLASKSLFTADTGEYVFAPVVKTESKSNADVNIDSNNVVVISGGQIDSTSTSGMDLDGTVKLNFELSGTTQINLNSNNTLNLGTDTKSIINIKSK